MIYICINSKYGFCKFGNRCNKIHFTDTCDDKKCTGWRCDKRHPDNCFYFEKFRRCKFGSFCSYRHEENEEAKLKAEVASLKLEVFEMNKNIEELKKVIATLEQKVVAKVPANETLEEEVIMETNQSMGEEAIIETNEPMEEEPLMETNELEREDKTLEDIIRENSESETSYQFQCERCEFKTDCDDSFENHLGNEHNIFSCDKCDFLANSLKGLKIHKAKKHTKVSECDGKLYSLVRSDVGFDAECYICGFKGILHIYQHKSTLKKHFKEKHDYISEEDYTALYDRK